MTKTRREKENKKEKKKKFNEMGLVLNGEDEKFFFVSSVEIECVYVNCRWFIMMVNR